MSFWKLYTNVSHLSTVTRGSPLVWGACPYKSRGRLALHICVCIFEPLRKRDKILVVIKLFNFIISLKNRFSHCMLHIKAQCREIGTDETCLFGIFHCMN